MKTKQERIEENIKLFEKMKSETILRYAYQIEFDRTLSLYDVMISHFVEGDLDDIFLTDVVEGMSDEERKELFSLAREFKGLCFSEGDPSKWLSSVENTKYLDYDLIAYCIFDNYNYLLNIAKYGGRAALEQLQALQASEELNKMAVIDVLRNSFVDDRVLTAVISDMSDANSQFNVFTDEQKSVLLTYPEGVLYSYSTKGVIKLTPPLLLARQLHNSISSEVMKTVDDDDSDYMSEFFKNSAAQIEFYDEVLTLSAQYRDFFRQRDLTIADENISVVYDPDDSSVQRVWNLGDAFLGKSYDTPYSSGSK